MSATTARAAIAARRGIDQTPNTALLNSSVPGQKERRAAEHRGHRLRAGVPQGMGDGQLVADGGDDDAGHHRQVEVGVGGPAQRPGIVGTGDGLRRGLGAAVEIDPPQRDAAEEGDHERGQRRPA